MKFSVFRAFRGKKKFFCGLLFFVNEPVGEFLHCLGPVAYLVLDFLSEFRETFVVAIRDEDWVIAKPLSAMLLMGDTAFHYALEAIFARAYGVAAFHLYKRDYGAEASLAVRVVAELGEQFPHVCFTVVVGALGIACRVNPRLTVERVNLKPSIICETVYVVLVEYIFSLLMCVGFQ